MTETAIETALEKALTMHREGLLVDLHSDIHLDVIRSRGRGETGVLRRRHLPLWRKGGVDAVILNTIPKFGPQAYNYYSSPSKTFLQVVDCIHQEIEETADDLMLVLNPGDLLQAKKEGKVGLIIGVEGAEVIEYEPALLRCFEKLGLRIMNLTWHQRNLMAEGIHEPGGGGLSRAGKDLVRRMNDLGIMIDLSHLSLKGVDDVLEVTEFPVIASHSNARALCPNARNLDDERLRAIGESGGLVGCVFLGRFVAENNPTIEDVCRHIDHLSKQVGEQQVGLGPDYADHAHDLIIGARGQAGVKEGLEDAFIGYAEGLETADKLPALTAALLERGYHEDRVRGIMGLNFHRFWSSVRA